MVLATAWKVLYWAWVVAEVGVLVVTRTRRSNDARGGSIRDRGSLGLLWGVIFASIFLGSWLGAAFHPARMHAGRWLAPLCLALLVLGLLVRWSAILTLGRSFSANVAIHSTQTLNRRGLFRYLRHPSYAGMVLIFLAAGLATDSWLGLGLIVLPPVAALFYRIHVEEAALLGAFGPEYVEYRRSTKRLIPGIY